MTDADLLAAWTAALDECERQVAEALAQAESTESAVPSAWQPAELPGPLPQELVERARQILASSTAAQAELVEALTSNLAGQRVTDTYASGAEKQSIYIDQRA